MVVRISGRPFIDRNPEISKSTIVASYDALKNVTCIDCNVDVVTLGIAVNVLTQEYENLLSDLEPALADEIKSTIMEVICNG